MYKRFFASLALIAALMCVAVPVTFAHAELVSSEPAAGATVATAPTTLRLVFSEALKNTSTVQIVAANGTPVNASGALDLNDLDHKTFVATLPALASGAYTVNWTSVSDDDGDTETGSFAFTVAGAAQATTAATSAAQPTAAAANTAAPASTAQPTPTVVANLPNTGEPASTNFLLLLAGVLAVIAAGFAVRAAAKRG